MVTELYERTDLICRPAACRHLVQSTCTPTSDEQRCRVPLHVHALERMRSEALECNEALKTAAAQLERIAHPTYFFVAAQAKIADVILSDAFLAESSCSIARQWTVGVLKHMLVTLVEGAKVHPHWRETIATCERLAQQHRSSAAAGPVGALFSLATPDSAIVAICAAICAHTHIHHDLRAGLKLFRCCHTRDPECVDRDFVRAAPVVHDISKIELPKLGWVVEACTKAGIAAWGCNASALWPMKWRDEVAREEGYLTTPGWNSSLMFITP